MAKPDWVLNVNPEGRDVLHRNPKEICNTDDAQGRQTVDAKTAAKMLASDQAQACEHCTEWRGMDMESEKPQPEGEEPATEGDELGDLTPLPEDTELPADEPVAEGTDEDEDEDEDEDDGAAPV